MKRCTDCGAVKPLDMFHRSSRNRDGRQSRCAECARAKTASYRRCAEYRAREHQWKRAYRARIKADPEALARHKFTQAVRDARRRAKAKGASVMAYTVQDLVAVHGPVESWTCTFCGTDQDLTVDHVMSLNAGGADTASNVVPACLACNSSKNDQPLAVWLRSPARRKILHRRYREFATGRA